MSELWELSRETLEGLALVAEADDEENVFHRWLDEDDTRSGSRELACRELGGIGDIYLMSVAWARQTKMRPCAKCFPESAVKGEKA